MGQSHGDMGIEQTDRRIELEKGQGKNGRGRHAVGQQPEKQMFVADKGVAGKGIGGRQGKADRNDHVDRDIDHRIDIARVPGGIGKDNPVIGKGQILGPDTEDRQNLFVGLKTHIDQPVDRQKQEDRCRW